MKHMTETVSSVLGTPEEWTNPLRDPRDLRLPRIAGPCSIVIFGVTGDLSRKKLLPAIYDLANRGLLPPSFGLTGFARRDWTEDYFKDFVKENVQAHCRTPFKEATWKQLADGIRFVQGTFDDPKASNDCRTLLPSLTAIEVREVTMRSTCRCRRARSRRYRASWRIAVWRSPTRALGVV